jgi:hypothetical protein
MTFLPLMLLWGCPASEPVCEVARSSPCACTDGSVGAQTCADDGSGWSVCECTGAATDVTDTATPTDRDTGVTGTQDSADTADTADTQDTGPADLTTVDVYLLGGQSNMSGIGEVASLPASLRVAQDDVWLWSSWTPSWRGLVPESEYGDAYFGPEVLFGRSVGDVTERPVALIKHSVGGTDLARFWNPGLTAADPAMGQGYSVWLDTVLAGLAALEDQGEVVRIAGMIWMQGESDAIVLDDAYAYEENMAHLISRVRDDAGVPELPFAMGLIDCVPCGLEGREIVRTAQQAVADADPAVYALETADLQLWTDEVHYNGPGMRTLGRRFAQALLGQPLSEPVQPALQLTGNMSNNYAGDYVVGWRFETTETLRITDLGWFDLSAAGLDHSHNLGVYDASSDTLVLTATISATEAGATPLVDGFRYVGIEPFELPPGDWLLGGTTYSVSDPDWYVHHAAIATAAPVTYTQACYAVGATLRAPTDSCTPTGLDAAHFFGPNLLYGVSEEPAL